MSDTLICLVTEDWSVRIQTAAIAFIANTFLRVRTEVLATGAAVVFDVFNAFALISETAERFFWVCADTWGQKFTEMIV